MKRAFTLIETLVAVTILTLAVAGPLVTASRAVTAAQIARDQLTASYLAQEGIEYVRMMRDNEYLAVRNDANASTLAWTNFLTSIASCRSATCTLDPLNAASPLAVFSGNAPLYLTNCAYGTGGLVCTPPNKYTQQSTSGVQTPFTRTIQAIAAAPGEKIVSKVSWTFHSTSYSVTVTTNLTPWQ